MFVQVLGMCPTLAVSNTARNALAMGLATLFVLMLSNAVVSSLRHFIPKQVRIATFILVIATFVTMVDYVIQAISLDLHKALGAFISLIVVNCLILGRAEAFASKNPVGRSMLDGLGMGAGFTFALFCLGAVREILGSGSLFGVQLLPRRLPGLGGDDPAERRLLHARRLAAALQRAGGATRAAQAAPGRCRRRRRR